MLIRPAVQVERSQIGKHYCRDKDKTSCVTIVLDYSADLIMHADDSVIFSLCSALIQQFWCI